MSVAISTRYVLSRVLAVVAVLLVCVSPTWAQDGVGLEGTVEGVLSLVWGDGPPEAPSSVGPFAMVTDDSGRSVQLLLNEDQVAPMGGMLALNGLPMPYHPVFNARRFEHATRDRFFLCIESSDPRFSIEETKRFLEGLGPSEVTEVDQ